MDRTALNMTLPDLKIEITANAVAWYGATVATASIILSLYSVLRDRARIKIKFQMDTQIFGKQALYNPTKTYLVITVVNKGRRPVRLSKAAIRIVGPGMKYVLLADSILGHTVKVLTEENPSTDFMIEQGEDIPSASWYVCIYDGTGKIYRKFFRIFPPNWKCWWKQLRRKPKKEKEP